MLTDFIVQFGRERTFAGFGVSGPRGGGRRRWEDGGGDVNFGEFLEMLFAKSKNMLLLLNVLNTGSERTEFTYILRSLFIPSFTFFSIT